MLVLTPIRHRLHAIIESLTDGNGDSIGLTAIRFIPSSVEAFPAMLALPRRIPETQQQTARTADVVVQYDLLLFLAKIGMRLESVNEYEVQEYVDHVYGGILQRPHLDHNDAGIASGRVGVQMTAGLSQAIQWPRGSKSYYIGAEFRLSVPYTMTIDY